MGLIVRVAIGVPCLVFAPHLLRLMGASPDIIAEGRGYTRIAWRQFVAVLLLFLNNAIFPWRWDAASPCACFGFSNIINLILDPCLISELGRSLAWASPALRWPLSSDAALAFCPVLSLAARD